MTPRDRDLMRTAGAIIGAILMLWLITSFVFSPGRVMRAVDEIEHFDQAIKDRQAVMEDINRPAGAAGQ